MTRRWLACSLFVVGVVFAPRPCPGLQLTLSFVLDEVEGDRYRYDVGAVADVRWQAVAFGVDGALHRGFALATATFPKVGRFESGDGHWYYDADTLRLCPVTSAFPGAPFTRDEVERLHDECQIRAFQPVAVGVLSTSRPLTAGSFPLALGNGEILSPAPVFAFEAMGWALTEPEVFASGHYADRLDIPVRVVVGGPVWIPEPATGGLLVASLLALGLLRRGRAR